MSREIRITPSILNADFSRLNEEINRIAASSDLLHLDVMDDVFVPNFTFDLARSAEIIDDCPIGVDAHLMVAGVDHVAPAFAEAGCESVTIHVEATANISMTAKAIRKAGARCGLGIKPGTSIDDYADYADEIDMFLIMTVEPGFGGQKFMYDMMEKVRRTRSIIGNRPIWLQVDGGISIETIEIARSAGADTFVAGSAVFNSPDPAEMVRTLRHAATLL